MNINSLPELNCFLKKFERQLSNVDVHVQSVKHTLRFNTFFTPGSIKTLRLYTLSNFYNHNNTFSSGKARVHNKILIKQSYVILAWIDYISKNQNLPTSNHSLSYGNNSTISSKKPYLSKIKFLYHRYLYTQLKIIRQLSLNHLWPTKLFRKSSLWFVIIH